MTFHRSLILLSAFFISLTAIISLVANSPIFLFTGIFYLLFIFLIVNKIKRENQIYFGRVVLSLLFLYSLFTLLTHFVFIDNAFSDFYINRDAIQFLRISSSIEHLDYIDIWQTAFTQFPYTDSSFFYAWTGTLQKIANLKPFYSLLYQKLNVAFLGSFIPGVVYLICNRVTDKRNAFKAAMVYGLLSFTFFFSLGLLRDIHIALIYAIGLYIITGSNYSLKNYAILVLLGFLAYFIRPENGLFFLAFLGVWMYKSSSENKWLISVITFIGIAGILFMLGGVEKIYVRAFDTIQTYSGRLAHRSGPSSLSQTLSNLPIPINYISTTVYGQLRPFPFWAPITKDLSLFKNLFYLPYYIAPLFWFLVWARIILNIEKTYVFFKENKLIVVLAVLYLILNSVAQPLERRLMAIYPAIFMIYIYISPKVFRGKEILYSIMGYLILVSFYILLKL